MLTLLEYVIYIYKEKYFLVYENYFHTEFFSEQQKIPNPHDLEFEIDNFQTQQY